MRLATECLEFDAIRTDGGTQIREKLNEAWVEELRALYEDGGHDLPPLLVVRDKDGTIYLADGFQRLEAMKRAGRSGGDATVRAGSLDLAKFLAAQANKHGLPRSDGDKKRAIMLLRETAEGRRMNQSAIAKHVGCCQGFVSRVITGNITGNTVDGESEGLPRARVGANAVLWGMIDAALRADPNEPSLHIAKRLKCNERTVRGRRQALGLKPLDRVEARWSHVRRAAEKAAESLASNPKQSNASVATEFKLSDRTVAKLRKDAGLDGQERRNDVAKPEKRKAAARLPMPTNSAAASAPAPKPPTPAPPAPPVADRWLQDMLQAIDRAGLEREEELREALNVRHAARGEKAA